MRLAHHALPGPATPRSRFTTRHGYVDPLQSIIPLYAASKVPIPSFAREPHGCMDREGVDNTISGISIHSQALNAQLHMQAHRRQNLTSAKCIDKSARPPPRQLEMYWAFYSHMIGWLRHKVHLRNLYFPYPMETDNGPELTKDIAEFNVRT